MDGCKYQVYKHCHIRGAPQARPLAAALLLLLTAAGDVTADVIAGHDVTADVTADRDVTEELLASALKDVSVNWPTDTFR